MASGTVYRRQDRGREAWIAHATWLEAGKRRQHKRAYRTKREAQAALVEILGARRAGSYVEPTKQTVATYLEQWLDGLENVGRRPTTLRNYRNKVELYIVPKLGEIALQDLRATDLDALYAHLLRKGGERTPAGLSLTTVHQVHVIVGKALHDAERKGLVVRSVARLASPPTQAAARADAPEMQVWSPAELRTFLSEIEGDRWTPVIHLLAMTGLRRSEAVALRWGDVDLRRSRLTVQQAASFMNGEESLGAPKSKRSRRAVDLDSTTMTMLRAHRARLLEDRMFVGGGALGEQDRVFAWANGEPVRPDSISQAFSRLVRRCDVPVIRLHDLRHTHASHLLAAGVNVKLVSERLGHASVAFTLDTYGHTLPGQQAEAAAAVEALVMG